MNAERWQQVKLIFDRAMECDPSTRSAVLLEECGSDQELRREVESLIASGDDAGSTLERIGGGNAAVLAEIAEEPEPRFVGAELKVGQRIGNYVVTGEIASGGMGVVWRARHVNLRAREAAIKCIRVQSSSEGVAALLEARFRQEAHIQSQLDHPGIVKVYEFYVESGGCYLVMELINGRSLRALLGTNKTLPAEQASVLAIHALNALSHAHNFRYLDESGKTCTGVVHRDIKPANLLLDEAGNLKLTDFGIAKIAGNVNWTRSGSSPGTLEYMSPEQIRGRDIDPRSDLYSLGITLYEALGGRVPFPRQDFPSDYQLFQAHLEIEPPPLGAVNPSVPGAMAAVVARAIRKDPAERFQTAQEFCQAILKANGWPDLQAVPRAAIGAGQSGSVSSSEAWRLSPGPNISDANPAGASPNAPELAHVLFMDIVGCSKLPTDEQKRIVSRLQELVRGTNDFRRSRETGRLISLSTGDGMALAFFDQLEAGVNCATELAAAIRAEQLCSIRMGVNTGPVFVIEDINGKRNLSGAGINLAERVMSCGDDGHILLSDSVAASLRHLSTWRGRIHEIGPCRVKDGFVNVWNLADGAVGNPRVPKKARRNLRRRQLAGAAAVLLLGLVLLGLVATVAGRPWLNRGGAGSEPFAVGSIAVLPFEDLSAEQNQKYFADGLADDLLNTLAMVPGLRVSGKTSSFRFRDQKEDVRVIGQKLNVDVILEGGVRTEGEQVRISFRMLNAKTGFELWSNTVDRERKNIFSAEEDIAAAVARELKVTLLKNRTGEASARSSNAEAYNAYLQGKYSLRATKPMLERAVGNFELAIRLDPHYAAPWVGLANAYITQAESGFIPAEQGFQRAREAAERALALDPGSVEAEMALGVIRMSHDWDWAGANAYYQKALAKAPGNSMAIRVAGSLDSILGRREEGIALYRKAVAIDPLFAGTYNNLAMILHYSGRQREAREAFLKAIEMEPKMSGLYANLSRVSLAESRAGQALSEAEKEPSLPYRLFTLALAHHALGHRTEADQNLAELMEKFSDDAPYQIAEIYAFRGEIDKAFDWLNRAYAARDSGLREIKADPLLKNLEHDARYRDFMTQKMRLPL